MYGNCLLFALSDFIKNGGVLYIEFWPKRCVPHFSVQRGDKVYDYDARRCILYVFWSVGKSREWNLCDYLKYNCKRVRLTRKTIKGII